MFRQKPEDMWKTIYLAPQNRKQNVKIQSRTLWKSFQLECTIYTIILSPELYDDVTKNMLTSAKNIYCNFVPYITYHIRGKFYYHSNSQSNFMEGGRNPPPPPPPQLYGAQKSPVLIGLSLCAYNIAAPVDYSPLADAKVADFPIQDCPPPSADVVTDDSSPQHVPGMYLFITE